MLDPLSTAVRAAGAYLRDFQSQVTPDIIQLKSLNSLVSEADRHAEEILVDHLSKLLPEAGFLTEEETIKTESKEYNWIIDPLDGTTNFLHGIPIYAVSVGLQHHDEIILGAVYEVGNDELFTAEKDKGSWLNGESIRVATNPHLKDTLLATGFPYYDFDRMQGFLDLLAELFRHSRGVRRMGTAATDLAYTACGRFDAYFEYGLSPWDVAAGSLLAREAGALVMDFRGGADYIFGKEIIAVQPHIADEFYRLLKRFL